MNTDIAQEIRQQITPGVLMSLGAHNFRSLGNENPGLVFNARILPFNENGTRIYPAALMEVCIRLNICDYYDITVTYERNGTQVTHFHADDVDCFDLPLLMLALDYNGEEVTNPRYF